uniref:Cytosolic carboxypeptidase NnaD n=2 Tax=Cacopsylla melanoneura TaxID=428564 RepID=A0A8D8LG76_9HEMI
MDMFSLDGSLLCGELSSGSYLSTFLQNTLKNKQVEIFSDKRAFKPVARLREPKDLLNLPKEIDCAQQSARWPVECQVIEDRVHHIEYNPPYPEEYYMVTGREIQPNPVGEEAGTVVFQYYPMSAVNYFSRSCVGGNRFFVSNFASEKSTDLKFESRFESGNLAKAVKISDNYYELYLRTDLYTNRHMQWFYFRITNTRSNFYYRFSIVNLSKSESLYSVGMKPLLYSTRDAEINKIGWRRCGENITYFRNDLSNGETVEEATYTLSFNLTLPYDDDEVYLAHCYPYTYSDLQDYLLKLQNHPVKSTFSSLRLLCRSLAGNSVYYLTITAPSLVDVPKRKKAIVITSRVHPGETPSSWMMKGFLDFLTGDSTQAKELREKFIFKLIPMLNPDGVIVGNNRCSLTGRDLNRQYRTVIRETYPPVWHTKLLIRRLMEECGVIMYCDLHAHSRKHNVFIYGCENKQCLDKRLQEQVFPLMLHKNAADKFSFENCKFRIQRSKEGTSRVVVWMMGIPNSYTMEASFGGSTLGNRADTHFSTQDFEMIGRAFCETLLDFCDEEPSKERLRCKIINRLLKEGSSADEPTNIELSDYSSDEGDSSSEDEACKDEDHLTPQYSRTLPTRPLSTPNLTIPSEFKVRTKIESPKREWPCNISSSPPLTRKTMRIHQAVIDLDAEVTTDIESDDEAGNVNQVLRKSKAAEDYFKGSVKVCGTMPPELIVTSAQSGLDGAEPPSFPEDNASRDLYYQIKPSPEKPRKSSVIKSHSLTRYDTITSESKKSKTILQQSVSFRQKLWTGVTSVSDYCKDCIHKHHSWSSDSNIPGQETLIRRRSTFESKTSTFLGLWRCKDTQKPSESDGNSKDVNKKQRWKTKSIKKSKKKPTPVANAGKMRFRKTGIVTTATVHSKRDTELSDDDRPEKSKEKDTKTKKKRVINLQKKVKTLFSTVSTNK